jgi:hypothetical protein
MNENQTPEENLADEFRNLGQNLIQVLQAAWDHPERKRIQSEFEKGINELGSALKRESDAFMESPSGQQLKTDVEDIEERLRSGEAQSKLRQELLSGLQAANAELQKIIDYWSTSKQTEEGGVEPTE